MLLLLPTLKIIQQVFPSSPSKPATCSCRLYNGGHAASNPVSAALVLPYALSEEFCHTTLAFSIRLRTVNFRSSPMLLNWLLFEASSSSVHHRYFTLEAAWGTLGALPVKHSWWAGRISTSPFHHVWKNMQMFNYLLLDTKVDATMTLWNTYARIARKTWSYRSVPKNITLIYLVSMLYF